MGGWILQKLDMLLGAAVAALAAMAASQTQAFVQQYLQRLGGHLDEAQLRLETVRNGVRYQVMNPDVRAEFENEALDRVTELTQAFTAISDAGLLTRPFALMRHGEDLILSRTWEAFVPAIPLDTASVTYVCMGLVFGVLVYEIVKTPLVLVVGRPRRRRFRRKGGEH